jgi:hypothetical protein
MLMNKDECHQDTLCQVVLVCQLYTVQHFLSVFQWSKLELKDFDIVVFIITL